MNSPNKINYNAIFISDTHLGREECQYLKLLVFLKSLETDDGHGYRVKTLYLNGDIIDITNFQKKPFFSLHLTVIKKLLRMKDKGVEIIYILGNHEAPIHSLFADENGNYEGITFKKHVIHEALNGKKYLVIHGDQFDGIVRTHPIIYKLGDAAYNVMNVINNIQNKIRRLLGKPEWSFAHWIKTKAKSAVKMVGDFETIIADYAKRFDVDGVMAGHIHMPEDRMIDGIHYLNSGTWVEICSAIIEDESGTITVQRFD
jgi:UDP-2,3-diacylglucosamine pyrophosphatase LpxH